MLVSIKLPEEKSLGSVNHRNRISVKPWLVWLSGLSVGCKPEPLVQSQSGHMPGLRAMSPSGGHLRVNHTWMFLSLSFSLPSSLSKNK